MPKALLTPMPRLRRVEDAFDFTARLMITEEVKVLPFGAIWAEFCRRAERPVGQTLIGELDAYQESASGRR